jgi:hypothetical protein
VFSVVRTSIAVVLGAVLCILPSHQILAQGQAVPAELTQILRGFNNTDWHVREAAFSAFLGYVTDSVPADNFASGTQFDALFARQPQIRTPVTDALMRLFYFETEFIKNARSLDEDHLDYFPGLMWTVARLRDARAIPDLVAHLGTGSIAIDGLAAFGAEALPQLLKVATGASDSARSSSMLTLSAMLEPKHRDRVAERDKASIKDALIKGAADGTYYVRQSAIQGLAKIPGDDVTALLKKIAETDPFTRSEVGRLPEFPVRTAARRALLTRSRAPSTFSGRVRAELTQAISPLPQRAAPGRSGDRP